MVYGAGKGLVHGAGAGRAFTAEVRMGLARTSFVFTEFTVLCSLLEPEKVLCRELDLGPHSGVRMGLVRGAGTGLSPARKQAIIIDAC